MRRWKAAGAERDASLAPEAAPSPAPRARIGVPPFMGVRISPRRAGAEQEADRAAGAWRAGRGAELLPLTGAASPGAAALGARAGAGRPLEPAWQARAAARYGVDGAGVRVHDDPEAASLAGGLGANAVTVGSDIFFAEGRYAPASPEGERVLAHELAHVAQQGGEPRAVQCDLAQSMPVSLGVFETSMITQAGGGGTFPGLMGTIEFHPDPHGPYSSEIGLVQAVNVTDVGGRTTPSSGAPADWNRINSGQESGRMELMTEGTGAAPAGWFIDASTAANARGGSGAGPNYIEHFTSPPPANQFGYLRSPTDVRPASLWDYPQMSFDTDFDFETVARGTDNRTVYGSLLWGFSIRSGAVTTEYAQAQDGASAVWEEALERYRGYYVHEPVVLYFATNQEIPDPGEEDKLLDVPDYLDRYPDVEVSIEGWADVQGGETGNIDLAQRRADAVRTLLLSMGVGASRIAWSAGFGETSHFSAHGTPSQARQRSEEGLLRANRRVVVTFSHTVSNHPIAMP